MMGMTLKGLVQQAGFEPFTEYFVAAAGRIRVGSGLDPNTDMGPLIAEPSGSVLRFLRPVA
jgi:acyl-CoA reductase-like NAD-dependent aldehyde dehydrogenase